MNDFRAATTGDWIRYARGAVGMTQQQLAAAAGRSLRTIAGIEANRSGMRVDTFLAIADALGTPVADLWAKAS